MRGSIKANPAADRRAVLAVDATTARVILGGRRSSGPERGRDPLH